MIFRFIQWREVFQSTLSVRRATNGTYSTFDDLYISIHALRKESDQSPHVHE